MNALVVETTAGKLRGRLDGGVRSWLGVPYAAPPVGALRMLAPRPPAPWAGERQAVAFGPAAPQPTSRLTNASSLGAPPAEDCLTLNVWAPAPSEHERPVLVWLHGGAFVIGSAAVYRGAPMAALAGAVIVTVNYRLGLLGFSNLGEVLELPELASNVGLRDQLQALRWVRENIAAFGGDPGRVTIAGESAGSVSVALLMSAAAAQGSFHGAIMQSGSHSLIHSRARSVEVAGKVAARLKLSRGGLAALQALPLAALQRAQHEEAEASKFGLPAAPWWDGTLLPSSLAEANASPTPAVPLLLGSNREEVSLFRALPRPLLPTRRPELRALLVGQLGAARAAIVMGAYPETGAGEKQLATDLLFRMPMVQLAERHAAQAPTWMYRFDYRGPLLGATHALELAFLWDLPGFAMVLLRGGGLSGPRLALATRMRRAWASFIATGTPGAGWPRYESALRHTTVFDRIDQLVADPDRQARVAWGVDQIAVGA